MPESEEKRELGGLARSIDALFSQAAPAREVAASGGIPVDTAPEPLGEVSDWEAPAADSFSAPEPPDAEAFSDDRSLEPDPFESLEAYEATTTEAEPEFATSDAPADGPEEAVWDDLDAVGSEVVEPAEEPVAVPVRDSVAMGLAGTGGTPPSAGLEEAVESFLTATPGAADEVRAIAVKLQERLALDPLADAVERLVHSEGSPTNEDAVALAKEIIDPAVASRLVQRMGHAEDDERRAEYVILSQRLGTVMANAFRGALTAATDERVRRAYYDGLIVMGETSRPVIEAMLTDDNRFLVRNAVALLGEIGGDGATELVTSALADTDARVRCEALGSLAKLGGEDSSQLVLASLEDSDAKVRAAAAMAAGDLQVERALKPILSLLDGEGDATLLVSLLTGLGALGDPGAVQAIEKRAVTTLFSKPPTEVRVAAYRALHAIGTPHARQVIQEARDDKDPVVRTTVRGLASTE